MVDLVEKVAWGIHASRGLESPRKDWTEMSDETRTQLLGDAEGAIEAYEAEVIRGRTEHSISADLGRELFMAGFNESGEGFNGEYANKKYRSEDALWERLRPVYETVLAQKPAAEVCAEKGHALQAIPPPSGLNIGICNRCGTVNQMDPDEWQAQVQEVGTDG